MRATNHQLVRSIAPLGVTPVPQITERAAELMAEGFVLEVIDGPTGHLGLALTRKGIQLRETPE